MNNRVSTRLKVLLSAAVFSSSLSFAQEPLSSYSMQALDTLLLKPHNLEVIPDDPDKREETTGFYEDHQKKVHLCVVAKRQPALEASSNDEDERNKQTKVSTYGVTCK